MCQLTRNSLRSLTTIQFRKSAFCSQKVVYVGLNFGQNQGLWRHFRDTMSPGPYGIFGFLKEVTLGLCSHASDFVLVARAYVKTLLPSFFPFILAHYLQLRGVHLSTLQASRILSYGHSQSYLSDVLHPSGDQSMWPWTKHAE